MNNWIRTKDRLPSKDDIILIIHVVNPMPIDYKYNVDIARFDGNVFVALSGLTLTHDVEDCEDDDGKYFVTHWQPLPEAPEHKP